MNYIEYSDEREFERVKSMFYVENEKMQMLDYDEAEAYLKKILLKKYYSRLCWI